MKRWWAVFAVILTVILVFSSCARAPTETPAESTPAPAPSQSPESTSAPAPSPSLPAVIATGRTVTEQDEAEDSDTWASYLHGEPIQAIAVGQDCLWLGTDSGLIRFSKRGQEITITYYDKTDGLPGIDIQALKFYGGELWIGTRDGGLSKFDGSRFINYGKEQGLFDPKVMALDADEDYVWLGLCFGLSRFDKQTQTFQNWELAGGYAPGVGSGSGEGAGFDPRRIYADSILIDGEHIWYAAYNAFRSDHELTQTKLFSCGLLQIDSRITSVCRVGNYVYLGSIRGLAMIDLTTVDKPSTSPRLRSFRWWDGLSSDSISALVTDGRYLWIGTDKGIDRFDTESLEIEYYEGYPGDLVLSLVTDERYIWIGTLNGLLRLNKTAEPKMAELRKSGVQPTVKTVKLSDGLLADFEPGGTTLVKVPDSYIDTLGVKIERYLDEGANGTEYSLCTEFELPAELEHTLGVLRSFIEGDITPYEGITFFIRMESEAAKLQQLSLWLVEHGPHGDPEGRPVEVWGVYFHRLKEEWSRVVVPFTAFELHARGREGGVNRIFDLPEVDYFFTFVNVQDWQAGDKVKIWLDEIRFHENGEFEPTVPDRGTVVNREKEE